MNRANQGIRSQIGAAGWVTARTAAQALEFGAWLVLARRLGPEPVGVLAVAMVVLRIAGLVGDWGAAFRGAREVAAHGLSSPIVVGLVRRRERVSLGLAAVWVMVALPARPELAFMAVVVMARGAGRDWVALGEDRRGASALPPLTQGIVLMAGSMFVGSVASAALVFAVAHGIAWMSSIRLNRLPPGMATPSGMRIDPWFLWTGLADQLLISGDTVVLALLRTTGEAGIYAMIYRYPAAWLTIVGLAVSAAVPAASRAARERPMTRSDVGRAARLGLVGGGALLLATPLAVASLNLVLGIDFSPGRTGLLILLPAAALTTASAPFRVLHVARGSDRNVAIVTAAAAAANLLANLALVGTWGITAAATTTLVSQAAMLVFFVRWAHRHSGTGDPGGHRFAVRATTSM